MGQLPLGGGDEDAKRFGDLSNMCKLLLILPHSTADPERLFSVIGKVDTSQRSSLLPSTLCNIVSVKNKCGPRMLPNQRSIDATFALSGKKCDITQHS